MRFFFCPGGLYKTEWAHQLPAFERSIVLFPTAALEGRYLHKGLVTPPYQDTRVQTAHTNIKRQFIRVTEILLLYNFNIELI